MKALRLRTKLQFKPQTAELQRNNLRLLIPRLNKRLLRVVPEQVPELEPEVLRAIKYR